MISPDIWQDPWFGKLSHTERVFFIGIISNCDDEGRILGEPPFLRSRIFVYEDIPLIDIESMLEKFSSTNNNFCLYSSNGSKYIALKKWSRYQKPEHMSPSLIPKPPFENHSPNHSDNNSPNDSPNDSDNNSPPSIGKYSIVKVSIDYIFSLWNTMGIVIHQKLTSAMETAITNSLKNYTQDDICSSIKNYAEILKDEKYYFKYKWTLKDFLSRGLEKFIDINVAKSNYLKDKNNGQFKREQEIKRQPGIKIER